MDTSTDISPFAWIRNAWREAPLEIIIPGAAGMALAQLCTAFFALRSYHSIVLWGCLLAAVFATVQTMAFLYRLSSDQAAGRTTTLYPSDLRNIFLPMILSVAVYGIIAPNAWLGIFYALVTVPQFAFLAYSAKRYAAIVTDGQPGIIPNLQPLIARAAQVRGRASLFAIRIFRKTPDFRRS